MQNAFSSTKEVTKPTEVLEWFDGLCINLSTTAERGCLRRAAFYREYTNG